MICGTCKYWEYADQIGEAGKDPFAVGICKLTWPNLKEPIWFYKLQHYINRNMGRTCKAWTKGLIKKDAPK